MQAREQLQRKPRSENRWEGEGGALHQSGAQLGPEPTRREPGRLNDKRRQSARLAAF